MGPTLSAVLDDARRRGFVGRAAQVRAFDAALSGAGPVRVLFVHGVGGIGKTTLLDELRRRAVLAGRAVVLLDGRDLGGSMEAVEAAVAPVPPAPDGRGPVLLVDGYELLSRLPGPGRRRAGRRPPHRPGDLRTRLPDHRASIGAMHACVLRDVLAKEGTSDPEALALRFAAETDAQVAPYVESTLAFDRHRLAEMEAAAAGTSYRSDDQGWAITRALWAGSRHDPVLTQTLSTIAGVLATPGDLLGDPALVERIRPHLGRSHLAPGPDRAELVETVRRAA